MSKLYVIRFPDRQDSKPIEAGELRGLIKKGEVKANDQISIYPNQFSIQAKDYTEFEDLFVDHDKTSFIEGSKGLIRNDGDKTAIFDKNLLTEKKQEKSKIQESPDIAEHIKSEKTGAIQLPEGVRKAPTLKTPFSKKKPITFIAAVIIMMVLYLEMEEEEQAELVAEKNQKALMTPIRPKLPVISKFEVNPGISEKILQEGIEHYKQDTVVGYRRATEVIHKAIAYDPQNVIAISILASSYLNLIESSSQDEKTFSVISKLIDLSKAKDATTVETLIAEVEFLATMRRYDAGIQKLVEYSNVTGKIDAALYYYISWLYQLKGENANALKYLNLIPASALPIPKLYYLRGLIHEQNQEYEDALAEYKRALKTNPKHAKSILGIVRVAEKKGNLKKAVKELMFLKKHFSLQSPKEYVETLVLMSKLEILFQKPELAVNTLAKALKIDPKNEVIKLDYYSLLSQLSKEKKFAELARMYTMVLESQQNIKDQKIHEATALLIQAKDEFPKSEIPSEKMGDLFYKLGEFNKAATNYKNALKINPKSEYIAVKMIDSSIKAHEWEDATKALGRFRSNPKLKSAIDRLAGDLEAIQGNKQRATQLYLKAMARDSVDTEVYSSYANILRENEQYKDAQFFYSLAQKYDPLSADAILGTAKCILKTDGVQAAVSRIQDELVRLPRARADLLSAIAEIQQMAGDAEKAILFADQAIEVDPGYAQSYLIKARAYRERMHVDKTAKSNALMAFLSYSEKKVSDPSGYAERFEIFLKDSKFNEAEEELGKIFEVSPRYPELHYKRAVLYLKMGKTNDALLELEEELKINPRQVKAWDEKGNILLRQNQLDEALKCFVRSMELDPRNAIAKMGAGQVNFLKRQFSSAVALFQAALSLDKGNPDVHKKLGISFREMGDLEKAKQFFRNYLDLDPNAPDRAEYEKYF